MARKGQPERTPTSELRLSRASAARLSLYLRCLENWRRDGVETVSSRQIAATLGIQDAQVRKDLTPLGSLGQPGVGYRVAPLVAAIRQALGIDRTWVAVLVGVGNLARALLRYQGFRQQGFHIAALFDSDASKVSQRVEGLEVLALGELPRKVRQSGAELGIITVPAEAAQGVADLLVEAGIRGVLNFAPAVLRLPAAVRLVNVDLTIQLEQLAFQVQMGGSD
jgi:redox-sensing transcriptional repressor